MSTSTSRRHAGTPAHETKQDKRRRRHSRRASATARREQRHAARAAADHNSERLVEHDGTVFVASKRLLSDERRQALARTSAQGGFKGTVARTRLTRDDTLRHMEATASVLAKQSPLLDLPRGERLSLTDRGYSGKGGGRQSVIPPLTEARGTTVHVAGLYPWATGAAAPLAGTPVGIHLETDQPVGFDPMTWFLDGHITAPIAMVIALNGYGKSSFVRRQLLGACGRGQIPMVLGDVKGEYSRLIAELGGQVVKLGYGYGYVNPLAVGALGEIAEQMPDEDLRRQVLDEMRSRQVRMTCGLVELVRGGLVLDYEETLVSTGLDELYGPGGFTPASPPLLEDLLEIIADGSPEMRKDAAASTMEEYLQLVGPLRRSLRALVKGPFGQVFNGHTTTPIDLRRNGVCIDVSGIPDGDKKLKAAVLMVCWSDGFSAIEAANRLADAGVGPQLTFSVYMDELWQVLGAGAGMVERVDGVTRLQRDSGVELWLITHTITDLDAFDSTADAKKASGFFDRARVKVIGPVGEDELDHLQGRVQFTGAERAQVVSWAATPPPDDGLDLPGVERAPRIPYGMGKFLIKFGESTQTGIPVQMRFTDTEWSSNIHNTNARFDDARARRAAA